MAINIVPAQRAAHTSRSYYYAAATVADGAGSGTLADPWSLADALDSTVNTAVTDGDVIFLRGGRYANGVVSSATNTDASAYQVTITSSDYADPIIVRNYPEEQVYIEGTFDMTGAEVRLYNLEISPNCGSRYISTGDGQNYLVNITQPGPQVVNCLLHDCNKAAVWSSTASQGLNLVYGNLMYNIGFKDSDTDTWSGHTIYMHRRSDDRTDHESNRMTIKHNGMGHVARYHMRLGSSGDNRNQDFYVYENVLDGNIAHGGISLSMNVGSEEWTTVQRGLYILFNYMTGNLVQMVSDAEENEDVRVNDNYFVGNSGGRMHLRFFDYMEFQRNSLTVRSHVLQASNVPTTGWVFENNTYYRAFPDSNSSDRFEIDGVKPYTFEDWKSTTGLDGSSSYQNGHATVETWPSTNTVAVIPNDYMQERAWIVIHNHAADSSVTVDLSDTSLTPDGSDFSARLKDGKDYILRYVCDPLGTAVQFTYSAATPTVAITQAVASHQMAPLKGSSGDPFTEFNGVVTHPSDATIMLHTAYLLDRVRTPAAYPSDDVTLGESVTLSVA